MRIQSIALLFLLGCAPAQLTFHSDDPGSAISTNKRGKQTSYVCSESGASYQCVPGEKRPATTKRDERPEGSASEEVELLKEMLNAPNGCYKAMEQFNVVKRVGAEADYHYYKGRCEANTYPDEACDDYESFLSLTKGDARSSTATLYVESYCSGAVPRADIEKIKAKIAMSSGCEAVSPEEFSALKKTSKSDYYFFKAYCARDLSPEKACGYYKSFIKVSLGDPRRNQAVSFIKSQDPEIEECFLDY